jgi:hypothetical protein
MLKILVIIGCCVALVGCETMQQQPQKSQALIEKERISSKIRAGNAAFKTCIDEVKATGIHNRLHAEILFENENSTNRFDLMTKNEYPTKEQIEYLKELIPQIIKCRTHQVEGYASTPFQLVALKFYNSQDEIYLKLIKSEITIGKANEERAKNISQQKSDWSKASTDLDARLNAWHESEMAGRRQAAAAMMPFLMQQQQNQQMQQQLFYQQQMQNINNNRPIITSPTTTNCIRYGNQIDCTTR